jgi:carbamoyl-phosphate synthase large subunit
MKDNYNILISSAGRRVALLRIFQKTLVEMGLQGKVFASDMSLLSSAIHSADGCFLVPHCMSPEFIPAMLDICHKNQIRLIVPTIDTELPIYASHLDQFINAGTTVAISCPEAVSIGGDKDKTFSWLIRNGFPTIRQAPVDEVIRDSKLWAFPLLVKPRFGSSSIGVTVVRDVDNLKVISPNAGLFVQTIAKGNEYTVDILADRQGNCLCAVPRKRLEVRGGEVSKGLTVQNNLLVRLAQQICMTLPGAFGALNVQIFLDDATGDLNVIEINPRFGGGFPLTWEAGGKYPQWMIEELLGLPSTASTAWKDGLVMLRYDDAVFINAGEVGI